MSIAETIVDMEAVQNNFRKSLDAEQACFHCGEPVPDNLSLFVEIDNEDQPMCCIGCQAVASAIIEFGLTDFYKFRKGNANKPDELVPEQLRRLAAYDNAVVQEALVESLGGNLKSTSLLLADMTCPACVWLIESRLSRIPGVMSISVNYSSQRAQLQWDESETHLSEILSCIATLGYKARPFDVSQAHRQLDEEQKYQLRRLGLAAVLGMQVMMISIALYVGDWSGMEDRFRVFLSWVCLLLTTPVVIYSAQTFFRRAWRDLRLFRTGMDVPVSLGILIAYINSIWATAAGSGQIYYDSIVMFVFFLLTGRYFEFRARRRSALYVDTIAQLIPAIATRVVEQNEGHDYETVAVASLQVGDTLLIRPGDVIPVDGYLIDDETTVDESLLTGESRPVLKSSGDILLGGASNIDQPVKMHVSKVGKDTMCSHVYRLMEEGQRTKPELIALCNRISAWFVFAVLMLAVLTAWYWHANDPLLWLPITISVLVVSCPCALSLATPVALAAASTALIKQGVILVNANAIEALNKVTAYVFDKTGTLTRDRLTITKIVGLSSMPESRCEAIATAIETNSLHPVAKAFAAKSSLEEKEFAAYIRHYPGAGISAEVKAIEYFLGSEKFIEQQTGLTLDLEAHRKNEAVNSSYVLLADKDAFHCLFVLQDTVREGVKELLGYLGEQAKSVSVLSGDNKETTKALADQLDLKNAFDSQTPDQKMAHIRELQDSGVSVAMLGDGVNDAPVLACANVSIAMGDGTALASANADLILLNSRLDKLIAVIKLAKDTRNIIQQNIIWAIVYNLTAVPLAVMGMITPWMAAIGMSLSSLIVVINSARINYEKN
jgi:P-type Cu2+ transporter